MSDGVQTYQMSNSELLLYYVISVILHVWDQPRGLVVKFLITEHEVPGSILVSTIRIFL
jgi:hypothetical protein